MGSRIGGGMASRSWPPPSCPGRSDSSPPAPWPCSPRAAVGCGRWGCRPVPSRRPCCSSGCRVREGREATAIGWCREGWKKCPGPSRRKSSQLPRARISCPDHLCCCERVSWLPRLPEPGRAGENPCVALGPGRGSCSEELPEHDLSTSNSLAQHSNLAYLLSWRVGTSCPGETQHQGRSREGHVVTIRRLRTSQSIAWRCHSVCLGNIRIHHSGTPSSIAGARHHPSLGAPSFSSVLTHVSSVTATPLCTPSPPLLSCARQQCFLPVSKASAVSSLGPSCCLWH